MLGVKIRGVPHTTNSSGLVSQVHPHRPVYKGLTGYTRVGYNHDNISGMPRCLRPKDRHSRLPRNGKTAVLPTMIPVDETFQFESLDEYWCTLRLDIVT